mgnify:CR=1 FL=1
MKRKSSTNQHHHAKPKEQTFGGRTFAELRDLVKPIPDADPNIFTTRELMRFWGTSKIKTLEMLASLKELGLCEPVYAARDSLHGETSVKAYRLKGDSEVIAP